MKLNGNLVGKNARRAVEDEYNTGLEDLSIKCIDGIATFDSETYHWISMK